MDWPFNPKRLLLTLLIPFFAGVFYMTCDWMSDTDPPDNPDYAELSNYIKSVTCGFANWLAALSSQTDTAQDVPAVQWDQNASQHNQHC